VETPDSERLRQMTSAELVRHALDETKLLARAEILHAKTELKEEAARAKVSGILIGAALALVLSALSALFVLVGIALPLSEPAGLLIVFAALLLVACTCGLFAWKALPKKPMHKTQERLKKDLVLTREQFA
jgi:uncharacterized membrane protein YqjE